MLTLLDKMLFVAHALLIVFVLFGWVWRRTRWLHLLVTGATAFSWYVLGACRGIGYCLLTDWHLHVRRQLGHHDVGSSYLQLLASEVFGVTLGRAQADWLGIGLFAAMLAATMIVWALVGWRWLGLGECRNCPR